jgi:nuclear pore complex protein Nup205
VADELGIDELVAAELVHNCSGDLPRLGMSSLQGSIALFHVRRRHVLDVVQFLLMQSCGDKSARSTHEFSKILTSVISAPKGYLAKVLDAMNAVEQGFIDLAEKEKRGQFLGQTQNEEFVNIIKLRRDFLVGEHDFLGQILCGMVYNKMVSPDGFISIIDRVKALAVCDTNFVHYIPSILLYLSTLDPALTGTDYTTSFDDAHKVYKALMNQDQSEWALSYWKGTILFVLLASFSGLCRTAPSTAAAASIKYSENVINPTKVAIDSGAIEFLMILAADTSTTVSKRLHYYDYRPVLQQRVPSLKSMGSFSSGFLDLLIPGLERLVELIVSNLADLLREMRLSEEDSFLSMGNGSYDDDEDVPGVDLERFFIFVSYVYSDRPDASRPFWDDKESNLYGFIVWCLQCHVSFMSAALCDMLASLACGSQSAKSVFTLLSDTPSSSALNGKSRTSYRLSWAMIIDSLKYYATQLQPPVPAERAAGVVTDIPELEDDVILLLSSYFRLISVIALNAEAEFSAANEFVPILFKLMVSQSPLYGSILDVLSSFAKHGAVELKKSIWRAMDEWVFNSEVYTSDGNLIVPSLPAKDRLNVLFKSTSDIVGLVSLMEALMRPDGNDDSSRFPFDLDLGRRYRVPGIWPYVDFLINEVFFSSAQSDFTLEDRLFLQVPCLLFIRHCLDQLDPEIARLSSVIGVNPDVAVEESFLAYLQKNPCAPAMSHLFSSKIYNILIAIVCIGIDQISEKAATHPLVQALICSLEIIIKVLDRQEIFLDVIVKECGTQTQISTHGLRSFEDALLYNLPIVTHLALYIGSPYPELAHRALTILQRLSLSSDFVAPASSIADPRVKKNRLLSALESVDECVRIREGVVEQLERPFEAYLGQDAYAVHIKLALLEFIGISLGKAELPTVAHFLLGFKVNDNRTVELDSERGGIQSSVSAFATILALLEYSVRELSSANVEADFGTMATACGEIVSRLVGSKISSDLTLELLRERDFALKLLSIEPIIDCDALWDGRSFASDAEFLGTSSARSVISFFSHRASFLEYLSMEIHASSDEGSLSLLERYVESLINLDSSRGTVSFSTRSAKILSLLDVLEISVEFPGNIDAFAVEFFGAQAVTHCIKVSQELDDQAASKEVASALRLKGLEHVATQRISSLDDQQFVDAFHYTSDHFTKARACKQIRDTQIKCIRSWSKLVLVLVNDAKFTPAKRVTFVLETFQTLIPKLVDYSSIDVEFAQVLASLMVSLLHVYQEDTDKGEASSMFSLDRSHALFKASVDSIQTPLSNQELRADLYMTCYLYLKSCIASSSAPAMHQVLHVVRSAGDKLLEIICTDALSGEGLTRLAALVLLESLCSLSARVKSTFILEGLVRYNLLLLLIRSIKRTDQEISDRSAMSSSELFFEIKVFKAIQCFLLQVAQTRSGASQIIQCGLFEVLQSCHFLNMDLDVGIELEAGTVTDMYRVSFYEILSPVFQVLCALILSMGAENDPVLSRGRQFLDGHQQLIVAILKKDVRAEGGDQLQELVKLLVLLISLTGYSPKER